MSALRVDDAVLAYSHPPMHPFFLIAPSEMQSAMVRRHDFASRVRFLRQFMVYSGMESQELEQKLEDEARAFRPCTCMLHGRRQRPFQVGCAETSEAGRVVS
eukprot:1360108-Rhodomonas_salina.2